MLGDILIFSAASEFASVTKVLKWSGGGGMLVVEVLTAIAVLPNSDIACAFGSGGKLVVWSAASEYTTHSEIVRCGHMIQNLLPLLNGDLISGRVDGVILIYSSLSAYQVAHTTLKCCGVLMDMVLLPCGDLACGIIAGNVLIWKASALRGDDNRMNVNGAQGLKENLM
jgi:hypothetical protein